MSAERSVRPITDVAHDLGIAPEHLLPYGHDKAKIRPEARTASGREPGRLILVSAITPNRAGAGKTTVSIGLGQGLAHVGENVCVALREPSLGPTFGIKGGATGGGKSVIHPAVDVNLHFTGDFHAITSANNLLAALLDNHLHFNNKLGIDVRKCLWRRVLDLNDRALREVIVGLGGPTRGVPRETGFDITPASEVMAVLCLAEDEADLRERLSRLIVALTPDDQPVTAQDLQAVGSMMAILKDALMPNLVQTGEGVPVIVHGGPFANIAHGCNSVIATKTARSLADWTLTEAGFGFDLGAEKFLDIKCRVSGMEPDGVVLVTPIRALRLHGGAELADMEAPDPAAVERGLPNLEKHLETAARFGYVPVVAINKFASDTEEEIDVVRQFCEERDVPFGVGDGFTRGGQGMAELARVLVDHVTGHPKPKLDFLYDLSDPVRVKIEKIAKAAYGARGVIYTGDAEKALASLKRLGVDDLPVCMAKTPASLTDDPTVLGRPRDFDVTVRDFVLSAGAGFLVPLLGDILRMPGLSADPQAHRIDLVDGEVVNLR